MFNKDSIIIYLGDVGVTIYFPKIIILFLELMLRSLISFEMILHLEEAHLEVIVIAEDAGDQGPETDIQDLDLGQGDGLDQHQKIVRLKGEEKGGSHLLRKTILQVNFFFFFFLSKYIE